MSLPLKPAGWRKRVQKEIGKKIPDEVWTTIIEKGYIDMANNEEKIESGAGLGCLLEYVESELHSYNEYAGRPTLPRPQKNLKAAEATKHRPPDERFQALSDIIAVLADKEEDIRTFREEVLNGKLLKPEEVPGWIKSVSESEEPTITVTFSVTQEEDWGKALVKQAKQVAARQGRLTPGVGYGRVSLSYINPASAWKQTAIINEKGTLGRLKRLANQYADFWPEAEAVNFILTGETYPISQAQVGYKSSAQGLDKVVLEVSPHLSGETVKSLYFIAKKACLEHLGKSRSRQLKEKHYKLAVFAVKTPGTWTQKREQWNREYPAWRYEDNSNFARDCRAAYERVTGWGWNG